MPIFRLVIRQTRLVEAFIDAPTPEIAEMEYLDGGNDVQTLEEDDAVLSVKEIPAWAGY